MTQVVLRQISLTRGVAGILRDVSLTVEAGEFCVFVGPSGCGKSTLLRLIAGLDDDASGEILIDGQSVQQVPAAKRNVAMVFQGYALYPHMSVYDNIAFALRRAKVAAAEIEARVQTAARILQLGDYLQRKPHALSGGQRQRVAIGRAIVKKPKVFLFDEPLSNLDASLRAETRLEIAKLHREMGSASMLYVTHDQVEAMTLADKIVLLRPVLNHPDLNSIVQIGRPMELYHRPANLFAARFIGTPGMNLFGSRVAALSAQGVAFDFQGQRCLAALSAAGLSIGDAVSVGIRPEHILAGRAAVGASGNTVQAVVSHIEALGEHSILHVAVTGDPVQPAATLLAKTTDEAVRVGDTLALHLPASSIHVFRADGTAQAR